MLFILHCILYNKLNKMHKHKSTICTNFQYGSLTSSPLATRAVQRNLGARGKNPLGGPTLHGHSFSPVFIYCTVSTVQRCKNYLNIFTSELNLNKLKVYFTCAFECKRVNNVIIVNFSCYVMLT